MAEHVKASALPVLTSIISEARCALGSTAGFSGFGDGVLHCTIIQPAGVAPVQTIHPGLVQLFKGGNYSTLIYACLHSVVKVQVVAAMMGKVWEYNT